MSLLIGKCRYCGKVVNGRKDIEISKNVSYQIITCKDCRDQLPRDDYIGKHLEA